eukprot:TRINITY_DN398_c0_g1_i5.p2 TRINITY_DN398_c0_g1~~TRINITY_DN398_c0_g1_i5.p2  ORF type:complete len:131 (-),score=8.90 TRINITY_DN398_c0_g1_i5:531-923(-)
MLEICFEAASSENLHTLARPETSKCLSNVVDHQVQVDRALQRAKQLNGGTLQSQRNQCLFITPFLSLRTTSTRSGKRRNTLTEAKFHETSESYQPSTTSETVSTRKLTVLRETSSVERSNSQRGIRCSSC